ncbi:MAG TPA: type IV toxin-antitoxin system AbiEi family antitoxin domain-containing protein [Legionella sp.]|nr:type IV toxin-antitoxin system AbiEi family antitoxin domain-containing protein [Legionella sp.]
MANKNPEEIFHQYGGQLKMSDAIKHGITRYMLYSLRDKGIIEQISRGLYRLTNLPPLSNQDLVAVSLRVPNAVICLTSALSYHELTTQIPHAISVAVPREAHLPSIDYPPTHAYRFSEEVYQSGIEEHIIDEVNIKIYSPEKTIVDCFKYRNKIGMDIILEAIKLYRARKQFDLKTILKYAKICRVERIITPYLEAII